MRKGGLGPAREDKRLAGVLIVLKSLWTLDAKLLEELFDSSIRFASRVHGISLIPIRGVSRGCSPGYLKSTDWHLESTGSPGVSG